MKNKGFMLAEVMISVVIISTGIIYIAHSFYASKNSVRRSREMIVSSLLLDDKMWPYEQKGAIEEGRETGDFENNRNFAWKIEAEEAEDEEINLVALTVYEKDEPEANYSIETYLRQEAE